MPRVDLRISGMDCAEEIAVLESEVGRLTGVSDLAFDLLNRKMSVVYQPQEIGVDMLISAVNRTGMRAELFQDARQTQQEGTVWDRWSRSILTAASGLFVVAGSIWHIATSGLSAAFGTADLPVPLPVKLLYASAAVTGAWNVLPKAWLALLRLRPDMNLLMTVAVIGALGIGEFFEAGTVAFLFALSLALESWSVGRARKAVGALMELAPNEARVIAENGNEELVPISQVAVGTRVIIKPGEKIPLDGKVVMGNTAVNQAPITGESEFVPKSPGDEVFAGTINQDGAIEVETVKPAEQSVVSQIIKMVSEAQSRRSPSEQWVQKFARYYTPLVLVAAIIVGLLFPLLLGNWGLWFYNSLVLLVIACPCALVISTPVSIVAALTSAARHGVLIKGGVYVELPAHVKAIAMDKTGTLTQGRPAVSALVPLSGHDEKELLTIASAIELRSEHPLARAIVEHAAAAGIRPRPVDNYQAVKGKGATALLDDRPVWIGSHRYLEERGQETQEMHFQLEELASDGRTVVVVGENEHVCGFIALADAVRPDAADTVRRLRAAGVQHLVMLTGDNEPTARAISRATGIDEFSAELLPQDKVAVVESLVDRYGVVAMVGDGVNDAPALARASFGIAMGAIGTAAAIETADIALMSDDLSRLPWLVQHAKRTLRIIRQNIVASLAVKAVFVLLTFAGYASLWSAIAADTGVSILVVLNALRLLR